MAGLRTLKPRVLVRLQPPELAACGVAVTRCYAASGKMKYPRGVAEARRPAKAEVMQVRLLPGILIFSVLPSQAPRRVPPDRQKVAGHIGVEEGPP